jgi:hypothetical protein
VNSIVDNWILIHCVFASDFQVCSVFFHVILACLRLSFPSVIEFLFFLFVSIALGSCSASWTCAGGDA